MKKSEAESPISCGFQTVSDKVFDRVKHESRGPIIGRCPLSLAGKLKQKEKGTLTSLWACIYRDLVNLFATIRREGALNQAETVGFAR